MDGRVGGRGGIALMRHVVYKGRALPLAWLVRPGKKGHFPAALHGAWVEQRPGLIPPGASGVLLGEGEFDGTGLQQTVPEADWHYVCRTGGNLTAVWPGETFRRATRGAWSKPGTIVDVPEVCGTGAAYGPIRLLCCWAKGDQAPLYVGTNMTAAEEACHVYAKRLRLDTFFSAQKRRGCPLQTSHIAAPERLSRLLLAAC